MEWICYGPTGTAGGENEKKNLSKKKMRQARMDSSGFRIYYYTILPYYEKGGDLLRKDETKILSVKNTLPLS
eukprot:scaffold3051_cov175-Amphora_coffeaeformis.AAC.6